MNLHYLILAFLAYMGLHAELYVTQEQKLKGTTMHYTVVLTPVYQPEIYIKASQELFGGSQPSYLLSEEGSAPHITVVQFDCETPKLAHEVFLKMQKSLKEFEPFRPPFSGVAFVEGTGQYKGTTWIELSVSRGDANSPIMQIHQAALNVLRSLGLNPLNAADNNYRPHLTLARIALPKEMKTWDKSLIDNPPLFKVEFGISDEKWQLEDTVRISPDWMIRESCILK